MCFDIRHQLPANTATAMGRRDVKLPNGYTLIPFLRLGDNQPYEEFVIICTKRKASVEHLGVALHCCGIEMLIRSDSGFRKHDVVKLKGCVCGRIVIADG